MNGIYFNTIHIEGISYGRVILPEVYSEISIHIFLALYIKLGRSMGLLCYTNRKAPRN